MKKRRRSGRTYRRLLDRLAGDRPDLEDPEELIASGAVLVDGIPVRNPSSRVASDAAITLARATPLRGEAKLRAAFDRFDVSAEGRVALDVGAAAGGFTRVLLERGARKVYAVDAGHGQLVGSLRADPRVVNLERTNLGDLGSGRIDDTLDLVVVDVSYLSLTAAAPQLAPLSLAADADLVTLVKPMFELALAAPPDTRDALDAALAKARQGVLDAGWKVVAACESPVTGARGALEFLIHARRG